MMSSEQDPKRDALALVLAGGQGRRLGGGDKALRQLGDRSLLCHVLAAVTPQVAGVALSANGDPARFASFGIPVLADPVPGLGPLGGMLAGLRHAAASGFRRVLIVPCDTPFLPADLATRLGARGGRGAYAVQAGKAHPTVAMLTPDLAPELAAWLDRGRLAVMGFLEAVGARPVAFDTAAPDAFLNINTPADLLTAGARRA